MYRSKPAEVLDKVLKAELIRVGWPLLKTHDLQVLAKELHARRSRPITTATDRRAGRPPERRTRNTRGLTALGPRSRREQGD
jgi:HEPN domain-containing protein